MESKILYHERPGKENTLATLQIARERAVALGLDTVVLASSHGYTASQALEVFAQTLYRFSQGMKVAVEVALMAADAGWLPMDREVIAIGGTDEGADTAIVLTPAYPRKLRDLSIREILAKPR